ncbi:NAD-dependent epimerase/dehydratase family protein [Tistrella bauzanensis]|uniref:NAD-dependent epimerase/dehydratase family protein n=1 Tax=Tistrella arctica TaxID=3133430 RepID=A0ABU9YF46_9PROT
MVRRQTALVLGATGGIGGEVARRLVGAGWRVRALHRRATVRAAADGDGPDAITWIKGDAMASADARAAAQGADLIVHAVNPPGYRDWGRLVLPMIDNTIAAAHDSGARILLPGTVYNYGPDAYDHGPDMRPVLTEASPQQPRTAKGAIRVALERRLERAADAGVRSLIVRAGDFFGPAPGNNWFSQGMVSPGRPVRRIIYPGRRGIGHQWAYLPDVADAMVRLVALDDRLAPFTTVHTAGHWDADGTAMIGAIRRAVARSGDAAATGGTRRAPAHRLPVYRLPWRLLAVAAPFAPLIRELREMRYLWQQPVRMDNSRLVSLIGPEPHTPLDIAVTATLRGLGCLPAARDQTSQPG